MGIPDCGALRPEPSTLFWSCGPGQVLWNLKIFVRQNLWFLDSIYKDTGFIDLEWIYNSYFLKASQLIPFCFPQWSLFGYHQDKCFPSLNFNLIKTSAGQSGLYIAPFSCGLGCWKLKAKYCVNSMSAWSSRTHILGGGQNYDLNFSFFCIFVICLLYLFCCCFVYYLQWSLQENLGHQNR